MSEETKRANAQGLEDSLLTGKTIIFLGSSVTYGAAAEGQSFVELFEHLDGVNAIKEAKSGTTLVDKTSVLAEAAFGNGESYIKRLCKLDPEMHVDCVVCQLSTNDATMKLPLGELDTFDTGTITGAIEYIIKYCRETWGCPVVFYTGSYYESSEYAAMVDRLYEIRDKWGIGVIDLYTDKEFNAIDKADYDIFMYDPIHPTKVGYSQWWMPKLESELKLFF
ncbi:MAG: SGNH/GDSL hydrolase family protein [Mogibacterium sp.]|nr:SGNH/GDSL hydrolase family protein [Mogibacterium sp.]